MKYKVYLNTGIEWHTEVEADNLKEAEDKAYKICNEKIKEFHDYNFDLKVTEIKSSTGIGE